uniref:Uncharacterized protein n=1 Tax=Cucumis melo TaxID=3656 RepID=A0A9I9ELR3_CUCME
MYKIKLSHHFQALYHKCATKLRLREEGFSRKSIGGDMFRFVEVSDAHISLVLPKDAHIRKAHYPIDEANRYPSVHTKPSTTVIPQRHSYYSFAIGFASQIVAVAIRISNSHTINNP